MRKIFFGLFLVVVGCSSHQSNPVRPELLISSSEEKISFPITDSASVGTVEKWIISEELPAKAVVSCKESLKPCANIKAVLKKHKVQFIVQPVDGNNQGNISLTYNHILAHGCLPSSFGCATAVNTVRMVTNHGQFIKPDISDPQDAERAVRALNRSMR